MKLDHFVLNIDKRYQEDEGVIEHIKSVGFPYEPKWGKGTNGFKVSNLWIGNEYLEMVNVLNSTGGGWVEEWTEKYNKGHRGLICLMLDVDDMDAMYQDLTNKDISATCPKWLEFKWFFGLLTRRMPWRNFYLPFFENVPLQIGFQEMKDEKARTYMNQYMVPNSKDNGIDGIRKAVVKGAFTEDDFDMLVAVFGNIAERQHHGTVKISLSSDQSVEFISSKSYDVEIYTEAEKEKYIEIENVKIFR